MTRNDFNKLVLLYIRLHDLQVKDNDSNITYLNMTDELRELLDDTSDRITLYRGEIPVANLDQLVDRCYMRWKL